MSTKDNKKYEEDLLLNVEVDRLSRMEVVENAFSPSLSSPYSYSSSSRYSSSSWSPSSDDFSKSEPIPKDLFINMARIYLHFNPSHFIEQRECIPDDIGSMKSDHSISVVLKELPKLEMVMERFSAMKFDGRRILVHPRFVESLWWKFREFLDREIAFYKCIHLATRAPNIKIDKILPFMPETFFDLFGKAADSTSGEFLFFRDIGGDCFRGDVLIGLNKKQVDVAIQAIAKFHAFSVSHMNRKVIGETLGIEPPDQRKETILKNWIFLKLYKLKVNMINIQVNEIRKFIETTPIVNSNSYKKFKIPPVVSHGDLCASNIFFEPSAYGEPDNPSVKSILGWNLAYTSTGLNDVARLLLTSVNSSLRLKHLDSWLRLYCQTFNASKRRKVYTEELVQKMFWFEYSSQVLFSFAFLADLYEKLEGEDETINENLRTSILGRILQGFEATL